jgi:hypothetical protein
LRKPSSSFFIPLPVETFGADESPRPGRKGSKIDLVVPVGLLDPGGFEIFQNDLRKAVVRFVLADFREVFLLAVNDVAVFRIMRLDQFWSWW